MAGIFKKHGTVNQTSWLLRYCDPDRNFECRFGSLADMLNCMKGVPVYPESRHFGAIEIVCYVLEADHPGEARAIRPDQLSKSLPPDRYSFRGRLPGAWFLERV